MEYTRIPLVILEAFDMSLRSRIEENVVITVAVLVIGGFGAGAGAVRFIDERLGSNQGSQTSGTCEEITRRVDALMKDHQTRMAQLQDQYMDAEKEASSFGHIDESHQRWVDSAQRLGTQIKSEDEAFASQIQALRALTNQARP